MNLKRLAMVCLVMVCLVIAPTGCLAQPPAGPPAFEVASVKPSDTGARRPIGIFTYPGGRITAGFCTLEMLIEEAFDLQPFQVSGGPRWMSEDRYDIVATPPAGSKSGRSNPLSPKLRSPKLPPNDEQRQMLQTLLADRFHLSFHREQRDGSVYLLVKSGKELKLRDPRNKDEYPWAGSFAGGALSGDGMAGENISMPQLAARLGRVLRRPVLDRTGLTRSYDFRFEYQTDDPQADLQASIFASMQGIGLKLEGAKGPVETIVIDRAEKPTEN